jgi:hypothetical protein
MTSTMLIAGILYLALAVIVILELVYCKLRAEPVALLILAAHGLLYFVLLALDYQDGKLQNVVFWNTWSSVLRLHTILTIVPIELFRMLRMHRIRGLDRGNMCGCE